MASRPEDEGIDLSPDAPAGAPPVPEPGAVEPAAVPPPGEGGVIAPGPTPDSR